MKIWRSSWFWIVLFTSINLLTGSLTELYNDEAYYWTYSRFLDWGYFDHPPVIALLIKIGYAIFPNELGVRLLSIISVSAALWLAFKLAGTNDTKLFALLLFCVFPFFLFGFTALPDSPMLCSIALFFWTYQQFIKDESWKWAVILAVVMALLLYTKYMGVLIILFTLASNIGLLKRKWFWIASMLGALLFLPHLYWQFANDFPSVQYHVVDRSAKSYQFSFTGEYIGAQLLFYGPFVGVFLYWAAWRSSPMDLLEKALKYVVGGTLVFFFLSSFKGRVEVNWTLGMLVPLMILTLRFFQNQSKSRMWLMRFAWISIPVIFFVRIHVIYPLADFKNDRAKDFHGHRAFANEVLEKAGGLPIAAQRYQTASSLWFYTGKQVPVVNFNTRFSQYDLWQFDTTFVNQPVVLVGKQLPDAEPLANGLYVTKLDSFPMFKLIQPTVVKGRILPQVLVNWQKPASFYAFARLYPIVAQVEFYNEMGIAVFSKDVDLIPTMESTAVEVPMELMNRFKTAQITLQSKGLGIIRKYPVVEFVQ